MKDFNDHELNAAREIITAGLKKAAESLSFFMKEQTSFNEFDYYKDWDDSEWKMSPKTDPNIHLLTTEIVGDLRGMCCLIFSEEEADEFRRTSLPEDIRNNASLMSEMSDAIMLEADNIISASVITQFSNILKHKMHGDVPKLRKLNYDALNEFVGAELKKGLYSINFKTHFKTAAGNFSPEFLWLLDKKFVESIKSYAAGKADLNGIPAIS